MLTIQHTEEALSLAFVQAVAAMAGVNLKSNPQHDYGVDGSFHQIDILRGERIETGIALEWQLKASTLWEFKDDSVVYDLEVRAYNALVSRKERKWATPFILILMCLPKSKDEWLELSEEQLILRKCCYWLHIQELPTDNTSTKRVKIPRSQQLTPKTIKELLNRVDQGEFR